MASIRTITDFTQSIEDDYRWRIIELSNFRNAILIEKNDKLLSGMLRSGVAILYAHWEGFVKSCANKYYDFVICQNLKTSQISGTFLGLHFKSKINKIGTTKSIKLTNQLLFEILSQKDEIAYFSSTSPIKTANLKYPLFIEVCELIGVSISDFESRVRSNHTDNIEKTIDESLVGRRNKIAHGEYIDINTDEFKKLYSFVINGLLYYFKEVLLDSAQNKKYLSSAT